MNKKGIRAKFPYFILAAILILSAVFLVLFFVALPTNRQDATDEYQITSYNVDMTVNEDNTFLVTETISVHFDLRSHGIYRYIPFAGTTHFTQDNKNFSERYYLEIQYVSSSHTVRYDNDGNNVIFILGNSNAYARENETYTLRYLVKATGDSSSKFDQFYYNFLGNDWDTTISNFSADITFNKPVDIDNFYFYLLDKEYVCPIENNSAHFVSPIVIEPFNALTGRAVLQEGYFTSSILDPNKTNYTLIPILLIGIGALCAIVCGIIFFVKNNRKKIVPIVEFSDIEGITPVDAGYIVDKETQLGEVSSLIVYWASKGYLKIEEKDNVTTLVKLKNSDDKMKEYEKELFDAMFKEEKFIVGSSDVIVSAKTNKVRQSVKEENACYFSKSITTMIHSFIAIFSILFALNIYFSAMIVRPNMFGLLPSILLGIIMFLSLWMLVMAKTQHITMSRFSFYTSIFVGIVFALAAFILPCVLLFDSLLISPLSIILTPIISCPMVIFAILFNDRIEGENKEVGRILGLRKFIVLAEEDRIKALCKDNPSLFYSVLPYAYVLGVSGVWIDKFKDIEIPPPVWYQGNFGSTFINIYIANRLLYSFDSFNNAIITSLPKSSGHFGGFGEGFGGGHIGGGMGGGGGGRW